MSSCRIQNIYVLCGLFNDTYAAPVGEDALDWNTNYFKGDILIPSYRSIGYDVDAQAYFKVSGLRPLHGDAKKEVPLVFIVSHEGQIPVIAFALQQKGKAAIIQEDARKLLPGYTANFYIQDSILIRMRTGEAISKDGFLLFVQPDDIWLTGEPSSAAITKAEKLILNGFQKEAKFTQYALPPIIRTSNYTNQKYPSLGNRMLAAANIFSTIDHFFTDKNLMDKNWEASYKKMIPKFIEAKDSLEYMRAVAELYANIADSHGYISSTADGFSLRLNPIIQGRGNFFPPVITRVIENKVVVTGIYNDSICKSIGIDNNRKINTGIFFYVFYDRKFFCTLFSSIGNSPDLYGVKNSFFCFIVFVRTRFFCFGLLFRFYRRFYSFG